MNYTQDISRFFIAGINYKKSDIDSRSEFSINREQYEAIFKLASTFRINELFILSTCNRTEIYGFAEDPFQLINLLCTQTEGSVNEFLDTAYIKKSTAAIEHLLNVAAGLDSQILGDNEVFGQLKNSIQVAKNYKFIGPTLERIINTAFQSSKAIKTETNLNGGTVSVSYAAVQYIKEKITDLSDKKILVLGLGKIGSNTCKNLVDYVATTNIKLINRSIEKAKELADELNLQYAPMEELNECIKNASVILVATNSPEPTITKSQLEGNDNKLIIDLSVPSNVEPAAQSLSNIKLITVDDLSKQKDETLAKRQLEVPKATAIISKHINEFLCWYDLRKHVPILLIVKKKLQQMQCSHLCTGSCNKAKKPDAVIKKVINMMAIKIQTKNQPGCQYIEAINEYLTI